MFGAERREFFGVEIAYQFHVFHILDSATLTAYQVNVLLIAVNQLKHGMVGEQMPLHNAALLKQLQVAIDGGLAHVVLRLRHFVTQHLHVEMPLDGEYLIQYGKALGSPATSLTLQKAVELFN